MLSRENVEEIKLHLDDLAVLLWGSLDAEGWETEPRWQIAFLLRQIDLVRDELQAALAEE